MSIRISTSSKKTGSNPVVVRPSKPTYNYDDEKDDSPKELSEEEDERDYAEEAYQRDKAAAEERDNRHEDSDSDVADGNNNRDERDDKRRRPRRGEESDEENSHQNGYHNGTQEDEQEAESKQQRAPPPVASKGPKTVSPAVAAKPSSVVPALLHKKEKSWPPPAPKKYDAFAVEGHGRMNPYTRELIPEENDQEPVVEDKRCEIDEGHTAPVKQLRQNWQGRKDAPRLGVMKPAASMKGETDWIKHIKPQVEYEEPPKEPEWLQLVRNRRWNSTVRARFPCKTDDIVDFERRSTTPKNWKRLLLDKKAVRTIGQITGIGAEGEELLWRLAKQRGKVEEGKDFPIPGEQDMLAYEHVKGNLEAAVADVAMQALLEGSEVGDDGVESVVSHDGSSGENRDRKQSQQSTTSTQVSAATIRQRLLRLHPEEFKKLLALDRARDAHLRWQFSTDPYDSVHEHQLQPFEIALLAGERENRLRSLLRRLLKPEDMPSGVSSGTSTPVLGRQRGRSYSGSNYGSDRESDSGSSERSQRRSRAKKKPPVPLPRKGRSVSPSMRNSNEDIMHGFLGPDDEHITSELKRLEEMAMGIGLPKEITDLLSPSSDKRDTRKERPEDSISMGLEDRVRSLLSEADVRKPAPVKAEKKDEPDAEITRSLADRKKGFFNEAEKAKSFRKEESEVEDSEIDTEEISSRRRSFLNKEKEAQQGSKVPEKTKGRHKVQRIKSDAELYAVLSKRRMATDDEDTATEEPSTEMKGILDDITKTFGGETYSGKTRRKPRMQSSEESDTRSFEEKQEEELNEEEVEDEEEEAPQRRSRRDARASSGGRGARRRARKWSESEDSEDVDDDDRVKKIADDRIRVKAKGRHAATRNPVKQLQDREDLRSDTDEYLSVGSSGSHHEVKLIGRNKIVATGKPQERSDLAHDAKKGLESKEDIKEASKGLKRTSKDKSGISKERVNPYDGVKPVMLFHVKGARNVQTRLVEPNVESMNSGDVFILVTPKQVHQWNGKFCSIMEKARGTEISSVIHQWKEMNCEADSINVMDQGKERASRMTKSFWNALGGKATIKHKDDVLEDSDFEKGILESTKIYEVEIGDDGETELVLLDEYVGKVPSKKWLASDKAYILDFGSEVYTWVGRDCKGQLRKKAVDHGLEIFEEPYKTSSDVSPLFPNEQNPKVKKKVARPDWAVFGKMTEKSENVLFRRKFYDWPDPVDLKPKSAEAKIHEQLTRDVNDYQASVELLPIEGEKLAKLADEPILIVNEMLIGRGKGGQDMETLFKYAVHTNGIQAWRIVEKSSTEISEEEAGFFFAAESYIIRWSFRYMRTGIRNIKGGKSKQDDTGKDCLLYFYWQGKDCTVADKGTAALMMSEIDSDEGPQMLVTQGSEPPAFYQLFNDEMVVNLGRHSEDTKFKNTRMYFMRNEGEGEACMVEIPVTSANLRSRGSIIVCDPPEKTIFVWHGTKSEERHQERAVHCAKAYRDRVKKLYQKKFKIQEVVEGEEDDAFWDALGDDEDYVSYLGVSKEFDYTPRCFRFQSLHNEFIAAEMTSSTHLPSVMCPFPLLQETLYTAQQPALFFIDAKYKMYLWQGWWPLSDEEHDEEVGPTTSAEKHRFDVSRRLSMQSIVSYAEAVGRPVSKAFIIYAGLETIEFKNLFPHWEDEEEIADLMRKAGKKKSGRLKLQDELTKLLKNSYTLEQLMERPLPEGVDPTRIEQYLHNDEFTRMFKMTKDEFNKTPKWKQIQLRKDNKFF